jgi:catechol 2,3-dioxygenase-like lactoylglutathione lyase family enzyme
MAEIMQQKLHLVTLGVSDFDRAMRFYRDGLGWVPSSASQDDVAFFPMGGVVFGLYPRAKLAEDATVSTEGSGFRGITLSYNTRSQEEVDAILQAVEGIGGKVVKPGGEVFWGGYNGYFADPEGHLWEVAWNPYFEFDETGNLNLP